MWLRCSEGEGSPELFLNPCLTALICKVALEDDRFKEKRSETFCISFCISGFSGAFQGKK